MGRSKRHEKQERKEGRVIIIERSGFVKIVSSANRRIHKDKDGVKPQKRHRPRLVFA